MKWVWHRDTGEAFTYTAVKGREGGRCEEPQPQYLCSTSLGSEVHSEQLAGREESETWSLQACMDGETHPCTTPLSPGYLNPKPAPLSPWISKPYARKPQDPKPAADKAAFCWLGSRSSVVRPSRGPGAQGGLGFFKLQETSVKDETADFRD